MSSLISSLLSKKLTSSDVTFNYKKDTDLITRNETKINEYYDQKLDNTIASLESSLSSTQYLLKNSKGKNSALRALNLSLSSEEIQIKKKIEDAKLFSQDFVENNVILDKIPQQIEQIYSTIKQLSENLNYKNFSNIYNSTLINNFNQEVENFVELLQYPESGNTNFQINVKTLAEAPNITIKLDTTAEHSLGIQLPGVQDMFFVNISPNVHDTVEQINEMFKNAGLSKYYSAKHLYGYDSDNIDGKKNYIVISSNIKGKLLKDKNNELLVHYNKRDYVSSGSDGHMQMFLNEEVINSYSNSDIFFFADNLQLKAKHTTPTPVNISVMFNIQKFNSDIEDLSSNVQNMKDILAFLNEKYRYYQLYNNSNFYRIQGIISLFQKNITEFNTSKVIPVHDFFNKGQLLYEELQNFIKTEKNTKDSIIAIAKKLEISYQSQISKTNKTFNFHITKHNEMKILLEKIRLQSFVFDQVLLGDKQKI